jgi:benzylsuccinate CoA-transferase BbsF subunit
MSGVLEGIKVADFSWVMVGPMAIRYLADYGATVIHVESGSYPDLLRTTPPYKNGDVGIDRAGYFGQYNVNKYSLALDLRHAQGREIAQRLVTWADVVAESFTPGTMEKWGLGYEDISKVNPQVIMLRTSMQGQTGPHRSLPGTGVNLVGLSGFTHLCGWSDREPNPPYGPYTDSVAARYCAALLIAALDYRRRTGKGQLLDVSQYEAGVSFIAPLILDYFVNHRVAGREGNYSSRAVPHNAYRCRGEDRWCTIAVFTDEEWQAFCSTIGNPSWTKEARFATFLKRKENEAELDRRVEEWTIQHTAEEVTAAMQKAGVRAGIVQTIQDLHQDPQLKHRSHWWTLNHREMGPFAYFGQACKLSRTPAKGRIPSPCLGEHTEYVCKEFLGMSEEEFDDLLVKGAFG